jgi:uncharacterized protein YktA (UPF0223 family)
VKEYLDSKRKFREISYCKAEEKKMSFSESLNMQNRPKETVSSFG